MLGSCATLAVIETLQQGHFPIQHILILGTLGLMGLVVPSGKPWQKVLYTVLEMGLVFYGTLLGYLHILPTLYLIVLIRSCFIFNVTGRWAIAGLSLLFFVVHQIKYIASLLPLLDAEVEHQFWMHQSSEILMFAVGLFFVLQFVNTWLSECRTREQLGFAHEQLRQYSLQVEDLAAVQERNRIARDIHDSLGHALTALNVQLQTAVKLWEVNPMEAKTFLTQARRLGDVAIQEVRQSVHALRVDTRAREPLETAIATLAKDFHQSTGIPVTTDLQIDGIVPAPVHTTLYRLVQEALTNICKHAHATAVQVQVQTHPDRIGLTVVDDGRGFQPSASLLGFGLQGMQERVEALKGTFHITSTPGAGCRVTVELPLMPTTSIETHHKSVPLDSVG
ncbi:sensor histidine kinase [Synechococcales cyanobacterium C]|uniref:Oxygen sensor histidine kinase NreB n=2 Tax=Petrachloros TaxID=2918834 RepID=A0A8K2A7Q2_9CYAN|nr:sensor histidine kinase [Petrachloros mirabilis ULC683]